MLLVTRPREQAQDWVSRLQAYGVRARCLPLLGIHPAPGPEAVQQSIVQLPLYRAVMFVSPNAVLGWQASSGGAFRAFIPWPAQTLAVAPGPGTASALLALGVPAHLIVQPPADALQFDSEALWPQLQAVDWMGQRVLVVRGEGGRDWLIQRWQEAGAQVHTVAAYRRGSPALQDPEVALLLQACMHPQHVVWLLSSSEALDHLKPLVQTHAPQIDFGSWAGRAQALATHPRILERAHQIGLVRTQACRADLPSVVASYNQTHREP